MRPKSLLIAPLTLTRTAIIPSEWRGIAPLVRNVPIPAEWLARRAASRIIPYERLTSYARNGIIPTEWTGQGVGDLSLVWNDLAVLNQPLLLSWFVLNFGGAAATFTLSLLWDVLQTLASLPLSWNDVPDVFTPFGVTPPSGATGAAGPGQPLPAVDGQPAPGDIQKPTATTTKTP